jgi:hypothetical protein
MEVGTNTEFLHRIEAMTVDDLDHFFFNVDMDPMADMTSPQTHLLYRATVFRKHKKTQEEIPMHALGPHYYSAQRIAYILFKETDPVNKSAIITTCGLPNCINPKHLRVEKKKT